MQKPIKIISWAGAFCKISLIIGVIFLLLNMSNHVKAKGIRPNEANSLSAITDTSDSEAIRMAIEKHPYDLYYPKSVAKFYQQNGYKFAFMAPETVKTHAADAMMLLDCVIQYGLNPTEYHYKYLTYERLNRLVKQYQFATMKQKAAFDILLTDAMITLINNLHFGKLNPYYAPNDIDNASDGFLAGTILHTALLNNDFVSAIESVQPKSIAYSNLQRHMHLLTGIYVLDCYDIPDSTIRLMAINMERLRWKADTGPNAIDINIPAYLLTFYTADSTYSFKIHVADPATPTPILKSEIHSFNVSYFKNSRSNKIVIPITNFSQPYLISTSRKDEPKNLKKIFTRGSVEVENARKLVELLLINEHSSAKLILLKSALKRGLTKTIHLKRGVEISINYLTCEVKDGELLYYDDIYNLDPLLELRLYGIKNQFANNSNQMK
jgi:murein L,D-transpeptidase YcbB/YkuD